MSTITRLAFRERPAEDGLKEAPKFPKNAHPVESYTVGWVCALPKEQAAAKAMLDTVHPSIPNLQSKSDKNAYILGSIGRHNVVITCLPSGRIGNSSAASVATNMASTFPSIKIGLLVGIGGGIPSKVRLGDVVVSHPTGPYPGVVQWDLGKANAGGNFERTGSLDNPPTILLAALSNLRSDHEMTDSKIPQYLDEMKERWPKMAKKYLRSESLRDVAFNADCKHVTIEKTEELTSSSNEDEPDDCRYCDVTKAKIRKPRSSRIHYGLIASGNQVIKGGVFRDKLNKDLGGQVLCVEMEAAGLKENFPCLVIRGICDYADSHKNKAWQEYAAAVAAAFAKEVLEYVQPEEVEGERSVKEVLQDTRAVEDSMLSMNDDVGVLLARSDQDKNKLILSWLSPINYGAEQSDFFALYQQGTGLWFLDSGPFQRWMSSTGETLFCYGDQGSGKTTLTALVVDKLITKFDGRVDIGLAYLFLSYKRTQHQRLPDLLANLIKQISSAAEVLPIAIKKLYDRYSTSLNRPSPEALESALIHIAQSLSEVIIIVDGLDECETTDDCRTCLLKCLNRLQRDTKAKIFITSRYSFDMDEVFSGYLKQEIRATPQDVELYVRSRVPKVLKSIKVTRSLRTDIQSQVTGLVDGMFLLAKLCMDSLEDVTSAAEVRETLKEMGSQEIRQNQTRERTNDIYHFYDQAMERIKSRPPRTRNLAMQTLAWVIHAERPLEVSELQHALAVKEGDMKLDFENIRGIQLIIEACAGLVTIGDGNRKVVRPAHETTQRYLESLSAEHFPTAHLEMTSACVTYLMFHGFNRLPKSPDEIQKSRSRLPLSHYAASKWGHHARKAGKQAQGVMKFLKDEVSLQLACMNMDARKDGMGPDKNWKALHVAAHFGLVRETETLINDGFDTTGAGPNKVSPMMIASVNGYDDVVQLMSVKGADIQAMTSDRKTSLILASMFGHRTVVETLLNRGAKVTIESYTKEIYFRPRMVPGYDDVIRLSANNWKVHASTPGKQACSRKDQVEALLQWGECVRKDEEGGGRPPVQHFMDDDIATPDEVPPLDPFFGA